MQVPASRALRRLAVLVLAAVAAPAAGAGTAWAADPPLLYMTEGPAVAIDQGVGGGTWRQAPAYDNPHWSAGRRIGKVRGSALAAAGGAPRMAAMLRTGWRSEGGLVAVDEITPARWDTSAAAALADAMTRLGPDAQRVMFYASPSLVEQVGRADPRRRLPARLGAIVDAISRGRATYLLTYRGNMSPFPAREMATHPTRWVARWPAGRGDLRIMLGPDRGIGQAALWARARSTAAGRELLADGVGAYGLSDAAEARAWVAQYRAFRAAPTVSATGVDFPVAQPGGLVLKRAGVNRVRIVIARAGRAVVTMTPRRGGRLRAIKKLSGPTPRGGRVLRLPSDARPGLYTVRATLIGDGLRDRAAVVARVRR
jgi:hypothetical protein